MTNACDCSGIRVWRGYRSEQYDSRRDAFLQKLESVFLPATVQAMSPIGLKAYFPAVLPPLNDDLPDEIALVVYGSPEAYTRATKTTVSGRAYGLLHSSVFNFSSNSHLGRSTSAFPQKWEGSLLAGQPCFLGDRALDWHSGAIQLSVIQLQPKVTAEELGSAFNQWCSNQTSIFVYEKGYLLLWEHYTGSNPVSFVDTIPNLVASVVMKGKAQTVYAKAANTFDDPGVAISDGDFLDVRLSPP